MEFTLRRKTPKTKNAVAFLGKARVQFGEAILETPYGSFTGGVMLDVPNEVRKFESAAEVATKGGVDFDIAEGDIVVRYRPVGTAARPAVAQDRDALVAELREGGMTKKAAEQFADKHGA